MIHVAQAFAGPGANRRILPGLFCISAGLLAYELLLMRLLALAYWGHYAALMISIALLGLAASGLFLHFNRRRVIANVSGYFSVSAGLFGALAPLAFVVSQFLPFTPFLLAWSPREYAFLGLRVLLFFVPFFCAGIAIGAPFVARVQSMPKLYLHNMVGSAAGSLPLVLALSFAHPYRLLIPCAALGVIAAWLTAPCWRGRLLWLAAGIIGCGVTLLTPFQYSQFKDLSRTLTLPEVKIMAERSGTRGLIQTVHSPFTRYVPGLSLNFTGQLPPSELLFVDGSGMEPVFDANAALAGPAFLEMSPEAFSWKLLAEPRVLLLHGSALELLRATALGHSEIVVADPMSARTAAMDAIWQRQGRSLFDEPTVRRVDDDPRHFLAATNEKFDLIHLSQLGSHGAATAGAASLDPSWLFTRQSMQLIFSRLTTNGHLVATTWVENPPRAGVRLAALLIESLRAEGVVDPGRHLLALRSWSTLTFFVSQESFSFEEVQSLKSFADDNSFDLVFYPGIEPEEVNRMNVIPGEPYYTAAQAFVRGQFSFFARRSPFEVTPPTDDRPFFSHFFKWRALPQLVSTMGADWVPFVEWGYLLLVASLVIAALLGLLLLVVPAAFTRVRPRGGTVALFFLLGLAYIVAEMWAIYRLGWFVSHPLLATALVLTVMLASSGAGAVALTGTAGGTRSPAIPMGRLVIVLLGIVVLFPAVASWIYPQGMATRLMLGVLAVALPAFFMGFPFPFALERLVSAEEIPWALAMNGLGSVLGSLIATLLAVHFGLTVLGIIAVGLYMLAALVLIGKWAHKKS